MICTFYSYKGGVGRSMAMANVADILSRRGRRVLMIDFDLEAPGLEQFFHTNLEGVRRHPGLVDLLLTYKQAMSVAGGASTLKDVDGFIVPIYEQLPGNGRLDLMPAGQRQDAEQLARYALALRTFDWQDFYYNWEGDLFFEWLRRSLGPPRYDLVLVDSRTGVTEMGGICGYQLADTIVMLCAPNNQNVQGTAAMLRDFRSASVEGLRRGRPLDIVVVPARVEQRDPALLDEFFGRFEASLGGFMPERLAAAGIGPRDLMIPYEPRYAFQERVVSDPERADERQRIATVFERLADAVALLADPAGAAVPPPPAAGALPAPAAAVTATGPIPVAQYDATRRFAGFDVYLDASRGDEDTTRRLAVALRERGLEVFTDREDIGTGGDWVSVAEEALFHSRALLVCVGTSGLSEWRHALLGKALAARDRGQALTIVPVLLEGGSPGVIEETPLREFATLDFQRGIDGAALEDLAQMLRRPSEARVETEARAPYVGPVPMDERHVSLFFGRESEVREALQFIDTSFPVLITGPSGCGKTSLVRAGIIPALRALAPAQPWIIATLTIGPRPVAALDEARAALPRDPGARVLLFVDQLERLEAVAAGDRAAFLQGVREEAAGSPGLSIVLAVRSDARASLARADGAGVARAPLHVIELGPPSPLVLRAMIAEPAQCVGLAFEPGLVDRIVTDLGAGSASLALPQRLLLELWRRRRNGWLTNAAYADIGGMQGLIVRRADEVYAGLDDLGQRTMRSTMLRLVRLGEGGENTRRRVPRRMLIPSGPPLSTIHVLDVLVEDGLLVAAADDGEPVIEAAHEALVRGWPLLQQWLDDQREFLEWREGLTVAIAAWENGGQTPDLLLRDPALVRAEAKLRAHVEDLSEGETKFIRMSTARRDGEQALRESKRRWITGGAVLVALGAIVLAAFAFVQRQEAFRQRELANSVALAAKAQAERAGQEAQLATKALADVRTQLAALAEAAERANQERDLAAADRQRAEARVEELRRTVKTVEQLQKDADAAKARSGEQVRQIETLRKQIQK
jgi:cellulose biosynthesis protein BcsQ